MVSYKHYAGEVISGIRDEIVSPDDLESEIYPSAMTILRWLQWFLVNVQNMEGYLFVGHNVAALERARRLTVGPA